jgi:diacylglycerol kinase (ATP)
MENRNNSLISGFRNAFRGIAIILRSQRNARIELFIAISVVISGFLFRISPDEWVSVLICFGLVLGLEGINTAIELLADKLHPGNDPLIGKAKDAAAGAVLIASVFAAITGIVIFAPRILSLFLNH